MSVTAERRPDQQTTARRSSHLNIIVVFTSSEPTMAALRTAGTLASELGARITIVVPQVVSYQLPLDKPPVLQDWNERQFQVMANGSPVETSVRFYLCRDSWKTLSKVLKSHSLIVLGGKKRWWPTAESRLARRLRKLGHEVVFTETE
jgi:hypothetical protein